MDISLHLHMHTHGNEREVLDKLLVYRLVKIVI